MSFSNPRKRLPDQNCGYYSRCFLAELGCLLKSLGVIIWACSHLDFGAVDKNCTQGFVRFIKVLHLEAPFCEVLM